MKKYKVALKENHKAKTDQIKDGYLADYGVVQTYTRGEAIKKARMFSGEIELVQLSSVLAPMTMTAIPENALLDGVVKLLKGREVFNDATDMNEKIYLGDVFTEIFGEIAEMTIHSTPQKVLDQLDELAQLINADYVMITQS